MAVSMGRAKIKFTYEDYLQLPEDKRCELIEGEFYTVPSPGWPHQTILKKIFRLLDDYVMTHGLGEVRFAPLDVVLSPEWVVDPDGESVEVMVLGGEGYEVSRLYTKGQILSSPLLGGLRLPLEEIF